MFHMGCSPIPLRPVLWEAGLLRLAIARARRAGVAKEEVIKARPAW